MGCSEAKEVYVTHQAEVEKGSKKIVMSYFAGHGRGIGIKLGLLYSSTPFEDDAVTIPGGFIKRKVCGPMKYGSLPKMTLQNGTQLHQSGSITRYVAQSFKGAKGECLYPKDKMCAFWCDVLIEQCTGITNGMADWMSAATGKDANRHDEACTEYFADGGCFTKGLCVMEECFKLHGNKNYLIGDCITMADLIWFGQFYKVCVNPHIKNCAHVQKCAMTCIDKHPEVKAWYERMCADTKMCCTYLNEKKWNF